MTPQRIVILIAACAALGLLFVAPRFFDESEEASVPPVQLRTPEGEERPGERPRSTEPGARRDRSGAPQRHGSGGRPPASPGRQPEQPQTPTDEPEGSVEEDADEAPAPAPPSPRPPEEEDNGGDDREAGG